MDVFLSVDLPMDQIILTSSIFLARNIYTSQWCKFKSKSTERFLFWFLLWIFSVFFSLAVGEAVA
jgi:protein-arginine kinase